MIPRKYRYLGVALIYGLLFTLACSTNPSPDVSPQAKVAHYGTSVLQSVTVVQKAVTEAAKTEPSFVPAARDITTVIEKIHATAGKLGEGLQAYDAATTLDARRISEMQVQAAIAAINSLLVEAFNVKIPAGVGSEIASLIANVSKTVAGLSAELAKLKADLAPVPTPAVVR